MGGGLKRRLERGGRRNANTDGSLVALEAQIPTWGERGGRLEEEVGEGVEEECADRCS